jgi:hypothetical protein
MTKLPNPTALKGRTTREIIDDSIAGGVDCAFTESVALKPYIEKKIATLKVKGRLSVDPLEVYESKYTTHVKENGGSWFDAKKRMDETGGFFNPKTQKISLKLRTARVESAVHEGIHLLAHEQLRKTFGSALDEGLTAYFTDVILDEQGLKPGEAYPDPKGAAAAVVSFAGLPMVARAYFLGEVSPLLNGLLAKLGNPAFTAWRSAMAENRWNDAAKLLTPAR